ncbi:uncharacterized protein LOC129231471 [Uloborus diversus]|uniref:uncharacterized protein LOC129231471 n=1 Tax=Uloborus diversus TaxID=327109 RepID=UPI00240922E9|nr:uncharacterized protein LOC129231471 [Uloborus diversus]
MGIQLGEPSSSSSLANSDTLGEAAIILIAIGSVLIVLCAASIIYGLHRRRRHVALTTADVSTSGEETAQNPTDFMKSLATWDRCHSMEEILEKRRRSVWTLEVFENYSAGDANHAAES